MIRRTGDSPFTRSPSGRRKIGTSRESGRCAPLSISSREWPPGKDRNPKAALSSPDTGGRAGETARRGGDSPQRPAKAPSSPGPCGRRPPRGLRSDPRQRWSDPRLTLGPCRSIGPGGEVALATRGRPSRSHSPTRRGRSPKGLRPRLSWLERPFLAARSPFLARSPRGSGPPLSNSRTSACISGDGPMLCELGRRLLVGVHPSSAGEGDPGRDQASDPGLKAAQSVAFRRPEPPRGLGPLREGRTAARGTMPASLDEGRERAHVPPKESA